MELVESVTDISLGCRDTIVASQRPGVCGDRSRGCMKSLREHVARARPRTPGVELV